MSGRLAAPWRYPCDVGFDHRRTVSGRNSDQAGEIKDSMTDLATAMDADIAIPFAKRFVSSDAFRSLFREGMALVEETAAYLDGPGRDEARALPRMGALSYATESMRLTTRLMQLASWLLLQRAVAEGELSPDQAQGDRHRIRINGSETVSNPQAIEMLPEKLRDLIEQSGRLQARIRHLDALMSDERAPLPELVTNPIAGQLDLLRAAFPAR